MFTCKVFRALCRQFPTTLRISLRVSRRSHQIPRQSFSKYYTSIMYFCETFSAHLVRFHEYSGQSYVTHVRHPSYLERRRGAGGRAYQVRIDDPFASLIYNRPRQKFEAARDREVLSPLKNDVANRASPMRLATFHVTRVSRIA